MSTERLTPEPKAFSTRITEAFLRFNEWTPARKILLVGSIWLSAHVGFAVLTQIAFLPDDAVLRGELLLPFLWLWIVIQAVTLLIAGWFAKQNHPGMLPVYIHIYAYGTLMVAYMALTGLASMFSSFPFILAAGYLTIFGFRGAVPIFGYIFGLLLMVGIVQMLGLIPVAPAMAELSRDTFNDGLYLLYDYLWVLATVLIVATLIGLTATARDYAQQAMIRSNRLIRRYTPPAVAEYIIAGREAAVGTPMRQRVTVLFSDIVDFTEVADRVDPETTTQIVNDYMSAMAEIVDHHNGTLNEFAGDGLMSLFGAPYQLEPEEQARQAIAAAREMQNKMPELNRQWRKLGLGEDLSIRIGINTGVLSVGSFGSEGRVTYTAIGLQTNIAARIQSHCEPGGILISDATYALVEEEIDCEPHGEVGIKGVHFPVNVYTPR